MTSTQTVIYRALFATITAVSCAAATPFIAVGFIQTSQQFIDLNHLSQWEESVIFLLTGIIGLIFGLLSLWMYSRVTRKHYHE